MAENDRTTGLVGNTGVKAPVRVATTGPITLSGQQTIDGVAVVAGDRVLVKDQATGSANGIYVCDTGSWERSKDADGSYDWLQGSLVVVASGATNGGGVFRLTTANPITIDSSTLTFVAMGLLAAPVPVASGGTGATSAAAALANLGLVQVTAEAGTANALTGTVDALVTTLRADQIFIVTPTLTNTAATTAEFTPSGGSSLGAKNVFCKGAACLGGELRAQVPALLQYDGTQFNILGQAANAAFTDTSPIVEGSTDATKKVRIEVDGQTAGVTRAMTTQDQDFRIGALPRGHIAGLGFTAAGSSSTITIGAGHAADSTNVVQMSLASSIAKTTSGWAVGTAAGGLDTGAIANNTWYHFYEIMRLDTGVVDVCFSTSASTPNLTTGNIPTAYTKFRRIGSWKTDGSAQWVKGSSVGDRFTWDVGVNDVAAATNPGTSAVSRTLTVPTGIVVDAWFSNAEGNASNFRYVLWTALDQADTTPSITAFTLSLAAGGGAYQVAGDFYVKTNTSAQIRYRTNASGASDLTNVVTKGWIDTRGRFD